MKLPIKPIPVKNIDPSTLFIYGQQKIGKTSQLSELPNCLIIDTEKGTEGIECINVKIDSLDELREVVISLKETDHVYDFIALDTVTNITLWFDEEICSQRNVKILNDLQWGAGYDYVKTKTMEVVREFKKHCEHLIIVGHRKSIFKDENKNNVIAEEVNLIGGLKIIIMAYVNSIGYIYRDSKEDLIISFKNLGSQVEAGSRAPHLKNTSFKFEWNKIYPQFFNNHLNKNKK